MGEVLESLERVFEQSYEPGSKLHKRHYIKTIWDPCIDRTAILHILDHGSYRILLEDYSASSHVDHTA